MVRFRHAGSLTLVVAGAVSTPLTRGLGRRFDDDRRHEPRQAGARIAVQSLLSYLGLPPYL